MKLKSLEGLRGVAAFVVVVFHFLFSFYPSLINANPQTLHTYNGIELKIAVSPLNVLYNGQFAVFIFFVLSGFVLSYKYFKTGDNQVLTASASRRYIRLMIPALFSVVCMYILYSIKLPWVTNHIADFSFLKALWEGLYTAFFKFGPVYNPVLWTMHFEFFGSFLVFSFCLMFGKSQNRIWFYLLAIAIFWDTNYFAFILGMMVSDATNNYSIKLKSTLLKCGLLCVALFLGSYPHLVGQVEGSIGIDETIYSFLNFKEYAANFWHVIGSVLLLVVVLNSETINKLLSKSFFQFLGRISFSMYLTHSMIIVFFSPRLFDYFHSTRMIPYKYSFVTTFTISLIIIFALAYITERFIDRNAVLLSDKVYKRFFVSVTTKDANLVKPNRVRNIEIKS